MGKIVIVAYKPNVGREQELERMVQAHVTTLRGEGLLTQRQPVIMRAQDGTLVEVFEWKSGQAIEDAHNNNTVKEMWQKFAEICEYVPIAEVPESLQLFSEFAAVN